MADIIESKAIEMLNDILEKESEFRKKSSVRVFDLIGEDSDTIRERIDEEENKRESSSVKLIDMLENIIGKDKNSEEIKNLKMLAVTEMNRFRESAYRSLYLHVLKTDYINYPDQGLLADAEKEDRLRDTIVNSFMENLEEFNVLKGTGFGRFFRRELALLFLNRKFDHEDIIAARDIAIRKNYTYLQKKAKIAQRDGDEETVMQKKEEIRELYFNSKSLKSNELDNTKVAAVMKIDDYNWLYD